MAIQIWDASGWNGQRHVHTLQSKSIVELDKENSIRMKRDLINVGKVAAFQRKPCRFSLPGGKQEANYSETSISKNLRLLVKDDRQIPRVRVLNGEFSTGEGWIQTGDLLWLRWNDCPHTTIPLGISLEKLRVLQLINGVFTADAVDRAGYIWWAFTLLPKDFGNLTKFQHLDLSFCSQLKELPHSFKELVLLQHLDLQGCINMGIPPHFLGNLTGLKHLNFKDCRKLRVLPAQLALQVSLKSLCLEGTSLQELPNEMGRLTNLEVLEIGSLYLRILPLSIGNIRNLKKLNLEGCTSLTCLPSTLGLLQDLSINKPHVLKEAVKKTEYMNRSV
ncbi:hypothetical protein SUGI_0705040 [Cryptomeria japonica]|nr:hypothetical protein SUGI_0705040 [Cryptomeria japonica]